jgi:Acetyltransferase (GNAT) domain
MTRLDVGGKTIGQNCYFRGGTGSFHFKPAFDEEYARFSPGFHMECELIRYLHAHPEIEWMDSCTSSDNELFNRLFVARRSIQTLIVPTSGGIAGLLVSALPCLRYLNRTVRDVFTSSFRNGGAKHEVIEAIK